MNQSLKTKLEALPATPGVYIMRDIYDNIIYVGKAKILKNRVRSYFRKNSSHSKKVEKMVENINDLSWIVTDSELEALILECNLIKRHRPKYNILLKDDKTFPYIKITVNEEYPRILITRKTDDKNALYFGPYAGTVTKTVELLKKAYKIRSCNKDLSRKCDRECLNYHINQCSGPCMKYISPEEYRKNVDNVIKFLDGKSDGFLKQLKNEMNQAVSALEFEKAAELRDNIIYLEKVLEKQKISAPENANYDIIGLYEGEKNICITIMFLRQGKLLGTKNSYFPTGEKKEIVLSEFIKQYYKTPGMIPKEILLPFQPADFELITAFLEEIRNSQVNLHVPQKGKKNHLLEMAYNNAREGINRRAENKYAKGLSELAELLSLENTPERIEIYDISNTKGSDTVGYLTVFVNGEPKKSDYRKFKIKYVEGQNDYDCMYEVIYRRLMRYLEEQIKLDEGADEDELKFINLPDLIFVDGGKGHVTVGKRAVADAGLSLDVYGLVKDANHRTRDITSDTREYGCITKRAAFSLITRMQDETHNHAVSYHHSVRTKSLIKSDLSDIKGVGPKIRNKLFLHFQTIDNIKKATVSDLESVVGRKLAETLFIHFRQNE